MWLCKVVLSRLAFSQPGPLTVSNLWLHHKQRPTQPIYHYLQLLSPVIDCGFLGYHIDTQQGWRGSGFVLVNRIIRGSFESVPASIYISETSLDSFFRVFASRILSILSGLVPSSNLQRRYFTSPGGNVYGRYSTRKMPQFHSERAV